MNMREFGKLNVPLKTSDLNESAESLIQLCGKLNIQIDEAKHEKGENICATLNDMDN
nr:1149_t:CDS:2 [Entrophospora candida]